MVVVALLMVLTAALSAPTPASAHPLSTSAVLLTMESDRVVGQVQLPLDRLAIAVDKPLTSVSVQQPAAMENMRSYVADHISVNSQTASDTAWTVEVGNGHLETIDDVDHLVFDTVFTPPAGAAVDNFQLRYDAIVERLLSHRVFVSIRGSESGSYTSAGLIDWETQTVAVPVEHEVSTAAVFRASVGLGIEHIADGADHLLFLIMLLLPAPLLAVRGRWVRTHRMRRSCIRVVHVVTAFAVGHSVTLALAAFGLIHVPSRVVESAIAVSILVSGIHAIRPLVRGGEVWIAATFGLMHGIAFATLLDEFDTATSSLVTELVGFNVGIELTQLMVLALVMPSLLLLSRTDIYPKVRIILAAMGIVLATAWLLERTEVLGTDPFDGITNSLVEHPFVGAGCLAALAATTWLRRRHAEGSSSSGISSESRMVF